MNDEKIFINQFITLGIKSYINNTDENIFEKHTIECLCDIYGKNSIINLFNSKEENEFESLILKYGFPTRLYNNFLWETVNYERYILEKEKNSTLKTDSTSNIEIGLAMMFFYKSLIVEPTLENVSHFENDLLNNFYMIKYNYEITENPNLSRNFWSDKKRQLQKKDNVVLKEIKPNYLDEFTYARFGVKLDEVQKMDYRMVDELNKYIKGKIEVDEIKPKTRKKTFDFLTNTVVTSGNGFVDAILIASLIATEMSIGIIYLFLKM